MKNNGLYSGNKSGHNGQTDTRYDSIVRLDLVHDKNCPHEFVDIVELITMMVSSLDYAERMW